MTFGAKWGWGAAILALICSSCIPKSPGAIGPEGFSHAEYGYQVKPLTPELLLPKEWELDNLYRRKNADELRPKATAEYMVEYELDYDGDGRPERTTKDLAFDLRFKHLVHDGVIFVRTIPMSANMKSKKLTVLMDRLVEGIAGAGYETVRLESGETVMREDERYATVVTQSYEARLGGLRAYAAEFEVANVDQLKINPNARRQMVKMVLLHTPFKYGQYKHSTGTGTVMRHFPVMMLVGYANTPAEYSAGLRDFHGFLQRIAINRVAGYAQGAGTVPMSAASARTPGPAGATPAL